MNLITTGLAGLIAAVAITGAASAFDLTSGGSGPLKTTKVQLGIISPQDNVCPGNGKLTAWVQTNKPGKVDILIVKKGGNVAGPYSITTVAGSGGVNLGSYTQNLVITNPIDAEYRVVEVKSKKASNWVPLVAEC